MSTPYRIELSETAVERIRKFIPPQLWADVHIQLEKLAQDPVGTGRKSVTPPEPPGEQVFEFYLEHSGAIHGIKAFFRFMDDEETLFITTIGHVKYRSTDEPF